MVDLGFHFPAPTFFYLSQAKLVGSSGCAHLGAREPPFHFVTNLQLLAESHSTSQAKNSSTCFGRNHFFKELL